MKLKALSSHPLLYFSKVNTQHTFLCDGVDAGLLNRKSICSLSGGLMSSLACHELTVLTLANHRIPMLQFSQ